jgi:tetratricopeptide (TPR) repeat protein
VQLVHRIRQQEISLDEAFAEAKTAAACTTLDEESFHMLEAEVAQLTRRDPLLAYFLAHLKLTFVLHVNGPSGPALRPVYRLRGRCVLQAGHLSVWIGEIAYGQRLLEWALAHALYLEDQRCEVDVYLGLAQASRLQERADAAVNYYERALTLLRAMGDQERAWHVLHEIGTVQRSEGRYEAALRSYEETLATAQTVEDRRGAGYALQGRGDVQTAQGHYEAALRSYEQALTTAREVREQG